MCSCGLGNVVLVMQRSWLAEHIPGVLEERVRSLDAYGSKNSLLHLEMIFNLLPKHRPFRTDAMTIGSTKVSSPAALQYHRIM